MTVPIATPARTTESVVRHHLQAFLEHRGIDAVLQDYADDACFMAEDRIYRGKEEIRAFFAAFIALLPTGATDRFELRALRTDGAVAYITWRIADAIPLGTDTFLVQDGKIAAQTAAMYLRPVG